MAYLVKARFQNSMSVIDDMLSVTSLINNLLTKVVILDDRSAGSRTRTDDAAHGRHERI